MRQGQAGDEMEQVLDRAVRREAREQLPRLRYLGLRASNIPLPLVRTKDPGDQIGKDVGDSGDRAGDVELRRASEVVVVTVVDGELRIAVASPRLCPQPWQNVSVAAYSCPQLGHAAETESEVPQPPQKLALSAFSS